VVAALYLCLGVCVWFWFAQDGMVFPGAQLFGRFDPRSRWSEIEAMLFAE
jgi:hypothetical protein